MPLDVSLFCSIRSLTRCSSVALNEANLSQDSDSALSSLLKKRTAAPAVEELEVVVGNNPDAEQWSGKA